MKRNRYFVKGAIVLFIVMAMVFSSVAIANTQIKENQIELGTTYNGTTYGTIGTVVWDNGMDYAGVAAAQLDEQYPFEAECADDFHFEEDTEVCDVHWIGGYWQTGYESAHWPWEITFYYDDGSGEKPNGVYIGPLVFDYGVYTETFLDNTGTSIYYEFSVVLEQMSCRGANQRSMESLLCLRYPHCIPRVPL